MTAVVSSPASAVEREQPGAAEQPDPDPGALALLRELGLRQPHLGAHQLGDLLRQPVHDGAERLVGLLGWSWRAGTRSAPAVTPATRRSRRGCRPRRRPACSTGVRRSTRDRISAPAPITSARPGCSQGSASRSATVIATSRSAMRVHVVDRQHRLVDRVAVVGRQVEHAGGDRRSRCRRRRRRCAARAGETGHASRCASMSPTQAATSAVVGGSERRCRSCSRTEPMSIDCAAVGGPVERGAEDQLGGAATDVDDEHRAARARRAGCAPRRRRRARPPRRRTGPPG